MTKIQPKFSGLSKYVTVFDLQDSFCLFHSITLEKIFVSKKYLANKLNNKINAVNLNNSHFFKKHDTVIEKSIARYKTKSNPNFKQLYLIVTEACNFSCKYCRQVTHGRRGKYFIGEDELKQVINRFFKLSGNEPAGVVFYGGEPMLNKKMIISSVQLIRKEEKLLHLKKPIDLTIITNGTNIDIVTAKLLAKADVYIIISLDGTLEENNSMRVYQGGKGTFTDIIKGYHIFKRAGCQVGISCTVGNHNYHKLEKIFNYFEKELKPVNVGINLPHDDYTNPLVTNIDYHKLCDNLFKINNRHKVYVEHIMRKMRLLFTQEIKINDCPACGYRLVYLPGGRWGVCEGAMGMDSYFFNNLKKVRQMSKEWYFTSPLFDNLCNSCPGLGICGGGCPFDGYLQSGKVGSRDNNRCYFIKLLVEWGLKKFYKLHKKRIMSKGIYQPDLNIQATFLRNINSLKENLPLRSSANFAIRKI